MRATSSSFSGDFKIFLSKIYVQYCLSSEVAVSKMKNYVNVNLNLVLLRDTLWMGIARRKQQHKSISLISKLYWGNFVIEEKNQYHNILSKSKISDIVPIILMLISYDQIYVFSRAAAPFEFRNEKSKAPTWWEPGAGWASSIRVEHPCLAHHRTKPSKIRQIQNPSEIR